MSRYTQMLRERPHRAMIANAILFSLLLLMVGDNSARWAIGALFLGLAALWIGRRALVSTFSSPLVRDGYQFFLTWVPGLLAAGLALLGLHLMVTSTGASLGFWLGWVLFTAELVMLVIIGADLSPRGKVETAVGARG
jgi:hypothetical protein